MSKMIFVIYLITFFASAAALQSAQPPVQSSSGAAAVSLPVLSFVVDSAHRLRPLIGIVGSASVGEPLDLGFDVMQAAMPSGNDFILAMASQHNWPLLLRLRGETITVQSIDSFVSTQQSQRAGCDRPGAASSLSHDESSDCSPERSPGDEATRIDRIALSPSGSAAAFFSESQGRIYAFTNLSQWPASRGSFDVGGLGPMSAFGISDDGRTVALGISHGDTGSLFLLNAGQPARLIASMRHASAITFLHKSDNAIVADDAENKVYTLSGGQVFTVATADHGVSRPIGIAVSNDNQRVFVGNSQSGSVTTIGSTGTVEQPQYCNCTLTGLHPTNADSVFRLSDFSGGPVLLFDGSGATPRMIFVRIR